MHFLYQFLVTSIKRCCYSKLTDYGNSQGFHPFSVFICRSVAINVLILYVLPVDGDTSILFSLSSTSPAKCIRSWLVGSRILLAYHLQLSRLDQCFQLGQCRVAAAFTYTLKLGALDTVMGGKELREALLDDGIRGYILSLKTRLIISKFSITKLLYDG